jgi:hypothetical protein
LACGAAKSTHMAKWWINKAEVIICSPYWLISAEVFNVAPTSNQ